ncbi:uncharacterized protein L969DRAFT_76645 [Mixia osmundae IAM 14324]|uniref:Alpha/beta hydrolase fold-3 domain-containing protein n=1 Tax=Mixia osmundae (strain CBS 9802 / IAM 14324 / JCM 22182 / KY 12970) TaxID=764103 RepID=G7E7Q8_MIXOS|nr:uncharacterized protein L969DRAFT_76645 [Mixia osmundae IAM 14324]KEI38468.1 hypothetical protein L969DRAFT_76645 [Mixia osmundae IAM 14324]GAA98868.1 hypothetical protein E5Q_05556 [Mixia osmundae IAM 14324]
MADSNALAGDPSSTSRDAMKPKRRISPFRMIRFIPFLSGQALVLVSTTLKHYILGPEKPSWDLPTALFTNSVRTAAKYKPSKPPTIKGLRKFTDLDKFLPTPKGLLLSPYEVPVKTRGIQGFLAEADKAEDGSRVIPGEWVVDERLWTGRSTPGQALSDRVVLYLHGGAYMVMSAATHRPLTLQISRRFRCRVLAVNYRLAPETPFPGAIYDAVSTYLHMTEDLGIPPENIIVGGDSAGGGLSMATLLALRDAGLPRMAGGMLLSPWLDLSHGSGSHDTNGAYDYIVAPLEPESHGPINPVKFYLGDKEEEYLYHPYASPLFADVHDLPPLLIQSGDAEVLRDESTLLAHKLAKAGNKVVHEVYQDAIHVFQMIRTFEASKKALDNMREFAETLPCKPFDTATVDAAINKNIISKEKKQEEEMDAEPAKEASFAAGQAAQSLGNSQEKVNKVKRQPVFYFAKQYKDAVLPTSRKGIEGRHPALVKDYTENGPAQRTAFWCAIRNPGGRRGLFTRREGAHL